MTVLITGAAGLVGSGLRRELAADGLQLRLLDRKPVTALASHESSVQGDLSDMSLLAGAMQGVRAVVHLAGCTTDAPMEDQVAGNVVGAFNVFEAARLAGVNVKRIEMLVYMIAALLTGWAAVIQWVNPACPPPEGLELR